jgi:2,4-dienoyl-CoA reductase-like NADH-dependent reductase (Old Yellow Enzyme family)
MMSSDKRILFTPVALKHITLPNRFVRSATYEGAADNKGIVSSKLADIYCELAKNGTGTIITGFCSICQQGKAMQPAQAGIDRDECIKPWSFITEKVKKANHQTKIFMQLAHTGRQTLSGVTGCEVVGAGTKRCNYFRQKVKALTNNQIETIITEFANAAMRAQQAGFDGVQIHAAHGYLIHQFLSPDTNQRKDKWSDRNMFLVEVLKAVKHRCGEHFPILIKLSHGDDKALTVDHTIETVKAIETYIDAAEISYGTMELALNIFRGDCPVETILKVNPMFNRIPVFLQWLWKKFYLSSYRKRFKPFAENYNLDAAVKISQNTNIPVMPVGGIRTLSSMIDIIENKQLAAVSLCRPLICQPDIVKRIAEGNWQKSKCTNCNLCAIYCDTNHSLRCYCGQE